MLRGQDGALHGVARAAWLAAFFAYAVLFLVETTRAHDQRSRPGAALLLAAETGVALALGTIAGSVYYWALLVVVAGQLPFRFAPRTALAWVAAQSGLMLLVQWRAEDAVRAATNSVAFVAFQLFALGAARVAERERARR